MHGGRPFTFTCPLLRDLVTEQYIHTHCDKNDNTGAELWVPADSLSKKQEAIIFEAFADGELPSFLPIFIEYP